MGLIHRKLLDVATNPVLNQFCLSCSSYGCTGECFSLCPDVCNSNPPSIPPPSIPSSLDQQSDKSPKISPFLIATIILVAAAFLVVCCYAFYSRYYLRRRQSAPRRQNETPAHEDFLDEDESPVIDHPIWYIRTVGLQPSIISSITVCKYKRGEGIVEGAECSVCLSEFQEDETLRLLPKCSHAFHLPCIDTWLRSHTNCPMCRAPIVKSTVQSPSPELNVDNSGQSEETQVGNSQSGGGSSRELVDEVCELRIGIEEEAESTVENSDEVTDIQPMRRSVSMDSLSASKISLAMAKILPGVDSNKRIGSKRVDGNQNSMRISSGSSSKGRSLPNGLPPMRRSFSGTCGTVFRSF